MQKSAQSTLWATKACIFFLLKFPPSLHWLSPVHTEHPVACLLILYWKNNYIIIKHY